MLKQDWDQMKLNEPGRQKLISASAGDKKKNSKNNTTRKRVR